MTTFLIGLGGFGTETLIRLKKLREADGLTEDDLWAHYGATYFIAMDTDRRDLARCADFGITALDLSGRGTVGQNLAALQAIGADVSDWLPNTAADAVFLSQSTRDGAGGSRLAGRLCLNAFLADGHHPLEGTLFGFLPGAAPHPNQIRVIIVSSIAGGTGSGGFLQLAMQIKSYFQHILNISVPVSGLFAGPRFFRNRVPLDQYASVCANAYAAMRELNAVNAALKCRDSWYGKNIRMRIDGYNDVLFDPQDPNAENKLPFDHFYLLDESIRNGFRFAGDASDYDAAARILSSVTDSPLSAVIQSMIIGGIAYYERPLAMCGGVGAVTLQYPYDKIVNHIAAKLAYHRIPGLWTEFDRDWIAYAERIRTEDAERRAAGDDRPFRRPDPAKRGEFFIKQYETCVYGNDNGDLHSPYAFLRELLDTNAETGLPDKERLYLKKLNDEARRLVEENSVLRRAKTGLNLTKEEIGAALLNLSDSIKSKGFSDHTFREVAEIDDAVSQYAQTCLHAIPDIANVLFAEAIRSEPEETGLFKCSILTALLSDAAGYPLHPLAARYVLCRLRKAIEEKLPALYPDLTSKNNALAAYADSKLGDIAKFQRLILTPDLGTQDYPPDNLEVLKKTAGSPFRRLKISPLIEKYKFGTEDNLEAIEKITEEYTYFSALQLICNRLQEMIGDFERFFDCADEAGDYFYRAAGNGPDEWAHTAYPVAYAGVLPENINQLCITAGELIDPNRVDAVGDVTRRIYMLNTDLPHVISRTNFMEATYRNILDNVAQTIRSNGAVTALLDKNVFSALLDDALQIQQNGAADLRITDLLLRRTADVLRDALPLLSYDKADRLNAFSRGGNHPEDVTGCFPVLLVGMHPETANAIRTSLYPAVEDVSAAATSWIRDSILSGGAALSSLLNTNVRTVIDPRFNSRELRFFTVINDLQPYQISDFNEESNAPYFRFYHNEIGKMVSRGNMLTKTPHTDKRWHVNGALPYINPRLELNKRYRLAKSFVFTLVYGLIRSNYDNRGFSYVFDDPQFNGEPQPIEYRGVPVRENDFSGIIGWLAEREDLTEKYAAEFDECLNNEELRLAAKEYEGAEKYASFVLNHKIIKAFRDDVFHDRGRLQNIGMLHAHANTGKYGILRLAVLVKESEERTEDRDTAERILDVAEEVILRFARAPFSPETLRSREENPQRIAFLHILDWLRFKFLEKHCLDETARRGLPASDGEIAGEKPADACAGTVGSPATQDDPDRVRDMLRMRGIRNEITDSDVFGWLCREFVIDPDMPVARPEEGF